MPKRDECRPVTLPSGETIPVLGSEPLSPQGAAAIRELVEVVRAKMAAENPPDLGAADLYVRVRAAWDRGALWASRRPAYETAKQAGVKLSVLTRLANGRMPDAEDLARIEEWLARGASPSEVGPEASGTN